jgi:hypothetical protein
MIRIRLWFCRKVGEPADDFLFTSPSGIAAMRFNGSAVGESQDQDEEEIPKPVALKGARALMA